MELQLQARNQQQTLVLPGAPQGSIPGSQTHRGSFLSNGRKEGSVKLPGQVGSTLGFDIENVDLLMDQSNHRPSRSKNDVKEVKSFKQLEKLELDLDSPRFQQACSNLGITLDECLKKSKSDFVQKGVDQDLIDLRFKHFQSRLIDTLNRVLLERRNIKIREMQRNLLENRNISKSQSIANLKARQNIPNTQQPKLTTIAQTNQGQYNITVGSLGQGALGSQSLQMNTGSLFQTEVGIVDQKRPPKNVLLDVQKAKLLTGSAINSPQNINSSVKKQSKQFFPLQSSGSQLINNFASASNQVGSMPQLSVAQTSRQNYKVGTAGNPQVGGGSLFKNQAGSNRYSSTHSNALAFSKTHGFSLSQRGGDVSQSAIYSVAHPFVEFKLSQEKQKLEREKSLKLLKIKKQVEMTQLSQQRLDDYEKKLEEAQKRMLKKIKSESNLRKQKNTKRLIEVQTRALNLSKDFENSVLREMDKQNQSMSVIAAKHLQLESERRQELVKKEQEYQERLRQIHEWKREQLQQEEISLSLQLQSIDEKLNRTQFMHEQQLRRVASEARIKNDLIRQRTSLFRQSQEEQLLREKMIYEREQELLSSKMLQAHRKQQAQLRRQRQKQWLAKGSELEKNRAAELQEIEHKQQRIERKQKEAEQLQEEFKREQDHDFMLRNEARKLREEDIRKLRERQKRLYEQKKQVILDKAKEHKGIVRTIQDSEQVIEKKRVLMKLQKQREIEELKKSLVEVTQKGRTLTPKTKERLRQEGINLNLTKRKANQDGVGSTNEAAK